MYVAKSNFSGSSDRLARTRTTSKLDNPGSRGSYIKNLKKKPRQITNTTDNNLPQSKVTKEILLSLLSRAWEQNKWPRLKEEERAPLISVCAPDNELTLLRMKCLISIKRRPDMSPDSKGEMNQEATGEEEEEEEERERARRQQNRGEAVTCGERREEGADAGVTQIQFRNNSFEGGGGAAL